MARVAILVSTLFVLVTFSGCSSDDRNDDADKSGGTPADRSTETQTAEPTTRTQNCQGEPAPAATDDEVIVYFWCRNKFAPVRRALPSGGNRIEFALRQVLAGPSPQEADAGFAGSFPEVPSFEMKRARGKVSIDLDSKSFSVERFLAVGPSPVRLVAKTLKQFPGVRSIEITIDQKSMCELDEECSRGS